MKDCKPYKVGELLWRTTDNALFEITQVDYGMICENGDNAYTLKCVNHMDLAERVTDHEPETELVVNMDMVHAKNSIYTPHTNPANPRRVSMCGTRPSKLRTTKLVLLDVKI